MPQRLHPHFKPGKPMRERLNAGSAALSLLFTYSSRRRLFRVKQSGLFRGWLFKETSTKRRGEISKFPPLSIFQDDVA